MVWPFNPIQFFGWAFEMGGTAPVGGGRTDQLSLSPCMQALMSQLSHASFSSFLNLRQWFCSSLALCSSFALCMLRAIKKKSEWIAAVYLIIRHTRLSSSGFVIFEGCPVNRCLCLLLSLGTWGMWDWTCIAVFGTLQPLLQQQVRSSWALGCGFEHWK